VLRAALGLVTAGLAVGVLAACFSSRDAAAPGEGECNLPVNDEVGGSRLVLIRGLSFEPAETRVRAGERITWVNCDEGQLHTSTADGGAWASPLLTTGEAFTQTFESAGEFPYHCETHPFMTASVVVE
jgi:plastocyanin